MTPRLLITGGAGFIGSHLCDELLRAGYRVRVLDNLCPQVHGPGQPRPDYLADDVELVVGDVRDRAAVDRALDGVSGVYHLAAAVGVGQSMYQIAEYTSLNNLGTAVLLEAVVARREHVRRLVVASSMSIYGEGLYQDADGAVVDATERTVEQLRGHEWDVRGPGGRPLSPAAHARVQAAVPGQRLRPLQVRPGTHVPDGRPGVRHRHGRPCGSSTCSARGRRCPTRTPACWRSSPAG